jgi:putative hemolysin
MTALSRLDDLELRLATRPAEVDAAQALRYRVFYEELGARASLEQRRSRRDADRFDAVADHLIVVDRARRGDPEDAVVGCYRLLREEPARRAGGFYTEREFDLSGITLAGRRLELGRSCIAAGHRGGAVMQLLWRGIAEYLEVYDIRLMFGCASLPGSDPAAVGLPLAYLHRHHLAPPGLRPRALPHRRVAAAQGAARAIDAKAAMRALPPLLKGYLRLGGSIGEGAVVDHAFNTVDVCLVLPTASLNARYQRHFAPARMAVPEAA